MFKKILIAKRGEIAVRIIRAARELGIATVAVYSEADRESLHVKLADEAICIGPASSTDSYLKIPNIISAALITESEGIHPGYGFLAENASFAKICAQNNIVFIGPAINKIPVSIPPIISITQLQTHIPATVTAKQLREIHTDTAGMLTGEPAGLIFAIQRAVKLDTRKTVTQVYTANIVPLVVTLGIITQYPMLI